MESLEEKVKRLEYSVTVLTEQLENAFETINSLALSIEDSDGRIYDSIRYHIDRAQSRLNALKRRENPNG